MSYVFKMSMPGYAAATATPEQCVIHSSYPPFKAKNGQSSPHFATLDVDFTGTVTQGVTHTLYSFNHGYSHVPLALANIDFTEQGGQKIYGVGYAAIGATLNIEAYTTSTQFIVTIFDDFTWTGANARLLVSYYVFAENGA